MFWGTETAGLRKGHVKSTGTPWIGKPRSRKALHLSDPSVGADSSQAQLRQEVKQDPGALWVGQRFPSDCSTIPCSLPPLTTPPPLGHRIEMSPNRKEAESSWLCPESWASCVFFPSCI